jgi:hypothetical protein
MSAFSENTYIYKENLDKTPEQPIRLVHTYHTTISTLLHTGSITPAFDAKKKMAKFC